MLFCLKFIFKLVLILIYFLIFHYLYLLNFDFHLLGWSQDSKLDLDLIQQVREMHVPAFICLTMLQKEGIVIEKILPGIMDGGGDL